MVHRFKLCDVTGKHTSISGRIIASEENIMIAFRGYGEMTAADGAGCPIMIENCEGKLRLIVWGDINSEEPTNIIDLSGAKDAARLPEKAK